MTTEVEAPSGIAVLDVPGRRPALADLCRRHGVRTPDIFGAALTATATTT